jgi:hypothetical protein
VKNGITIVLFAIVYFVLGVITGALAGAAPTLELLKTYRLLAWVVIGIVFLAHVLYERARLGHTPFVTARHVAAALALYALAVAASGPVRKHWGTETQGRALLALILWPVITVVPGFFAAWVAAALIRPRAAQPEPSNFEA